MRKKKHEMAGGEMPEAGPPDVKTAPPKGAGMDMRPEGELIQVKKHTRHKGGGTQRHPAKRPQPLSMKFLERD